MNVATPFGSRIGAGPKALQAGGLRYSLAVTAICLSTFAHAFAVGALEGVEYPLVRFAGGQLVAGTLSVDQRVTWQAANKYYAREYRDPRSTIAWDGNTLKVCVYRQLTTSSGYPIEDYQEDSIPAIAAGDYTFEYSESTAWDGALQPPCTVILVRPFVVLPASARRNLIEYYNASLDHYFQTADESEQGVLDSGGIPGWTRTGASFFVFAGDSQESPDLAPVCRFYGRPEAGINSHFYSANPSDCAIVLEKWPESWQLESMSAFKVVSYVGQCWAPALTIWRVYNNRPDVNHRYVTGPTGFGAPNDLNRMVYEQHWLSEGPAWCAMRS